jgi:choline kinase
MTMIKKTDVTVIICCAGMGTRLGIGTTKALVDIGGEPLIIRQLKLLDAFDDIRVVVGFDAERVINVVKEYRKDIMFVCNYEYEHNGPADSLKKALLGVRKYVITLDGDTIMNPEFPNECIAVTENASGETISAMAQNGMVEVLSKKPGNMQWSGITKVQADKLRGTSSHVYEVLTPYLPMTAFPLRLKEINTPKDYENAMEWFVAGMSEE